MRIYNRLLLLALPALAIGVGATQVGAQEYPQVASASAYHCPSGKNPYDINLWLHVSKWCIDPGVRGQLQVKVQMEIKNRSQKHWLDIHQDRIRLVVRHFDRDRWSTPRGFPMSDRPIRTIYEGETVWAIPANPEHSYDTIPKHPNEVTFATHWYGSRLAPGRTFVPHYHYGDLVYYLPKPPRRYRPVIDRDIVGMAYVKNADVIALCPPDKWEEHVPSGGF
jgi:hypothetical protein